MKNTISIVLALVLCGCAAVREHPKSAIAGVVVGVVGASIALSANKHKRLDPIYVNPGVRP
jgi:ABC-type amino acid transport system permease subunit